MRPWRACLNGDRTTIVTRPGWLAGREVDTPEGRCIEWSQPEIVLYDDDPFIRMSYPDLVEDDGKFFVTETQKHVARVHEIPPALLDGLFHQSDQRTVAADGLLLYVPAASPRPTERAHARLPEFHRRDTAAPDHRAKDLRAGFSLDIWLQCEASNPAP